MLRPTAWLKQGTLPADHLLQRVWLHRAVAALRPLGAVVAEVLANSVPKVLGGQRRLESQGEHGEEEHRLHGHRDATRPRRRRHRAGGARRLRWRVIGWRGAKEVLREDRCRVRLVHVIQTGLKLISKNLCLTEMKHVVTEIIQSRC